jgi:endogenous inhibitor of DNA gyrase (YacG/DUF329 family)
MGKIFNRLEFCINPNCRKPRDDTFYDKSNYRPVCSKRCYSEYYDSLDRQNRIEHEPKRLKYKPDKYEFYKQGRLVLIDYNLSNLF